MFGHRVILVAFASVLGLALGTPASAASLEERLEALESEVGALREQRSADQKTIQQLQEQVHTAEQEWADVYAEVEEISSGGDVEDLAEANFMLTGYGAFTFMDRDQYAGPGGEAGTFRLMHFNPIIHYRMGDRLTWVSELEMGTEGEIEEDPDTGELEFLNEFEIELEYSYLDYEVTDWLTFRGGKFFTPLGIFNERLHPSWINKLPTRPIPYTGPTVLLPATDVGVQARGGVHFGDPMLNYAVAVTNGPSMPAGGHGGHGGGFAGAFTDNNHNKAVSGRLGVVPYPGFEFGVSGMQGAYTIDGDEDYTAFVVDGSVQLFSNMLDLRGEYIWTEQEQSGLSDDGDPLQDVDRDGWWVQAAHRFAWCDREWIMPLEAVVRYGEVESDNRGHGGDLEDDRQNLTFGLNYYIMNNFIARVAYDWYEGNDTNTRADVFTAMLTYGF